MWDHLCYGWYGWAMIPYSLDHHTFTRSWVWLQLCITTESFFGHPNFFQIIIYTYPKQCSHGWRLSGYLHPMYIFHQTVPNIFRFLMYEILPPSHTNDFIFQSSIFVNVIFVTSVFWALIDELILSQAFPPVLQKQNKCSQETFN